jgi:hypothetical protein
VHFPQYLSKETAVHRPPRGAIFLSVQKRRITIAWIESHQELLNHPKTLDLMSLMGWDVDTTIGKLNRFWWWCLDYAPDGDLRRHKKASLGVAVGLPAVQSKKFVGAMVQSGWLDRLPYFRSIREPKDRTKALAAWLQEMAQTHRMHPDPSTERS